MVHRFGEKNSRTFFNVFQLKVDFYCFKNFWNSNFIMWVARKTGRFSSWLWYMQYGRESAKKTT